MRLNENKKSAFLQSSGEIWLKEFTRLKKELEGALIQAKEVPSQHLQTQSILFQ